MCCGRPCVWVRRPAYLRDKLSFGLVAALLTLARDLAFLVYGVLPFLWTAAGAALEAALGIPSGSHEVRRRGVCPFFTQQPLAPPVAVPPCPQRATLMPLADCLVCARACVCVCVCMCVGGARRWRSRSCFFWATRCCPPCMTCHSASTAPLSSKSAYARSLALCVYHPPHAPTTTQPDTHTHMHTSREGLHFVVYMQV
jgi:hypothetical protein